MPPLAASVLHVPEGLITSMSGKERALCLQPLDLLHAALAPRADCLVFVQINNTPPKLLDLVGVARVLGPITSMPCK